MKNKSFLFLIAALALGLALAGCGGDTTTETNYIPGSNVNLGYAGPIADINAAFAAGASTVYLTKDTKFTTGTDENMLIIPSGRTLDLKGYSLTDDAEGYLVVEGVLTWDSDNEAPVTFEESYLIASPDFITANVGTISGDSRNNSVVVYGGTLAAGSVVASGTIGATHFALTADQLTGTAAVPNLPGFILGSYTPSGAFGYTGDGIGLVVTGDLTLQVAGTIGGGGTVTVKGKLTNSIGSTAAAGNPIVAGTLYASQIDSTTGFGKFNILELTSPVKASTFGENAEIGTFSALGPVTFSKDVAGTIVAEDVTFNGKVNAYPTSVVNKVTFGSGAYILGNGLEGTTAVLKGALNIGSAASGGTFTVSDPLTLAGGASLVLGAKGGFVLVDDGALTTGNYKLSGEGGILNNSADAGTEIVLSASGIVRGEGATVVPSLVFADEMLLAYNGDATISALNLDVENGGSIAVTGVSKTLTITGGGSITTGTDEGTVVGTLGTLYITTNTAGSLVLGAHGVDDGGSVGAGSYGTFASDEDFIYAGIPFIQSGTSAAFGQTESESTPSADAGSVAVFTLN